MSLLESQMLLMETRLHAQRDPDCDLIESDGKSDGAIFIESTSIARWCKKTKALTRNG